MTNQETLIDSSKEAISPKETAFVRWLTRTVVLLVVAAGWLMPEFYDWTGADQSRPAPIVGWIGLGILVADAFVVAMLVWLHFNRVTVLRNRPAGPVADAASVGADTIIHADASSVGHVGSVGHGRNVGGGERRWRFSMLHIFITMTLVAVVLMLARVVSLQVACWAVQVVVAGVGVWVAVQYPWTRWWIAWTATIQLAPFLWIFRQASILGLGAGVLAIYSGLPTLVPVAFFARLNRESFLWISTLLTTAEFAICVWLSYLGAKRALTGGIVVATLAVFSSFVFNALVRM